MEIQTYRNSGNENLRNANRNYRGKLHQHNAKICNKEFQALKIQQMKQKHRLMKILNLKKFPDTKYFRNLGQNEKNHT